MNQQWHRLYDLASIAESIGPCIGMVWMRKLNGPETGQTLRLGLSSLKAFVAGELLPLPGNSFCSAASHVLLAQCAQI